MNNIENYKEKIVKENNNTIVYIFYSPVIKRKYENLVLDLIYLNFAINDLWGYKIKNIDATKLLNRRGEIVYFAGKIIEQTKKYDFNIDYYIHTNLDKKLHIINKFKEKCSVFPISSFEDKIICDALLRIDRFDKKLKEEENWLENINSFKDKLKKFINMNFELFENRGVTHKDLKKYPTLQKSYKNNVKTI